MQTKLWPDGAFAVRIGRFAVLWFPAGRPVSLGTGRTDNLTAFWVGYLTMMFFADPRHEATR